jgi:hypothetical protein
MLVLENNHLLGTLDTKSFGISISKEAKSKEAYVN